MESGSIALSIGDSTELEGNLTLKERLKAFKSSSFDPDAYLGSKCPHMSEKVFLPPLLLFILFILI